MSAYLPFAPELRVSQWLNTDRTPPLAGLRGQVVVPYFWPNGTMPKSAEFEALVADRSLTTGCGSTGWSSDRRRSRWPI